MNKKESEGGTQSIERALSILSCFLGEKDALSLTDIARKTEIPIPTASRITRLLAQKDYLMRNGDNRFFKVGRKIMMLGYRAKDKDVLRNVVYDTLKKLRDEFGETAAAYIREGNIRRCFEKVEAQHDFRYSPTVGGAYEMSVGAGAKAFLAFMSEEERSPVLEHITPMTPLTIVDGDLTREELKEIERTLISKSFGQYCVEFASLASPVFNAGGEVICAVAITGPTSRFTPDLVEKACTTLVSNCLAISKEFGWVPKQETK